MTMQDWSCYTVNREGTQYYRRVVTAYDLKSAREKYEAVGNNLFVTAEPTADFESGKASSCDIRDRIKWLEDRLTPAAVPLANRRKKVPAIVAEVHNTTPVDAQKAWEAVVAACKGN